MSIQNLVNQARFTILLGKNGAGKSTLLRTFSSNNKNIKYISPERGGSLKYDPNVDTNIANDINWLDNSRHKNRFEQFRQQSAVQFRTLEMLILREIESDLDKRSDHKYNFEIIALDKINALLPAIKLVRSDRGFAIQSKDGNPIPEDQISSGEAELIALAIEVLVFSRADPSNKLLLLDEPDVHLHPDLQQRFTNFVQKIAEEKDIRVVIATHSTAIIGAFSSEADLQIVPVSRKDQTDFTSFRQSKVADDILPVFGVHPLSNAFNKNTILLVEGEDDKRVIEQIVRSSTGRYSWAPCPVETVSQLAEWEEWLNRVLPALYDDPKAFSLRDLDESSQTEIDDNGIVCRIRLNCYAMENILLTDQCFLAHSKDAATFLKNLEDWGATYPNHEFAAEAASLVKDFQNRRTIKIKNLRNIIVALLGSNKPWEVVIGQLIASHRGGNDWSEHSLQNYLGKKAMEKLFTANS